MPKFRKKPVTVDARGPITESEIVVTAHGRVRAEAGDYILTDPATGDTWPIKPDIFAQTYEAIGTETHKREVDGRQMGWLEKAAREIAESIARAINRTGRRYGFTLFLFSFDGPEMTYISNSGREDMIKALKEFIARQESGEADTLWHQRN